jgi:DNA-directed RNA polymerase subunit RPC12/RpoP
MNEDYQYQCQSCGVVGELDEYYEQFKCPQCDGVMLPLNTQDEPAPYELDEDATIAIPRDGLQNEMGGDIKVAQAVDLGFGGMLTTSVSTGKHKPITGATSPAPSSDTVQQQQAQTPAAAPVAVSQPASPAPPVSTQQDQASAAPSGKKPPLKGKVLNTRSKKKSFSIGKKSTANTQTAVSVAQPATAAPEPAPAIDVTSQPPPQPLNQQEEAPVAKAPQKTKKQGFQIKKKGGTPQKFGKKKSAKPTSTAAVPQAVNSQPNVVPEPVAPQHVVTSADTSTRSDLTSIQPPNAVVQNPELESAASEAAKFAALQAELDAANAAKNEMAKIVAENERRIAEEAARKAEEDARIAAEESARKAEEEKRRIAEEARIAAEEATKQAVEEAKRIAEEAAAKAIEDARRIAEEAARKAEEESARKAEEARKEAEEKAKKAVEQAKQEAIKAAEEKIRMEREEHEKVKRELEEHKTLVEKTALASAAVATTVATKLEEEDKKETSSDKKETDKKEKKVDVDAKKDESDDSSKADEKSTKSSDADDKDGVKKKKHKQNPFGKRPPIGGKKSKKGKGLSPLPSYAKKKKKIEDGDSEKKDENDDKKSDSSTTKTELDVPVSNEKSKSGKKPKRPLGKNGKPTSKKGMDNLSETKTKLVTDEEELHPELLKIHKKKRLIVQCVVSTILIVIGIGVVFGIRWYKMRPTKRHHTLVIPKKVVEIVPMVTAAKPAVAVPTSSLDGEFKALRRKVRKMPSKSLEGINAKIKIWQEFIDKNEKDHPDDPNIMKANAILKNLESVKTYY